MKKQLCPIIFICNLFIFDAIGQSKYIQIGAAAGAGSGAAVISAHKDWHLGKNEKFVIGTGLRFTSFFGNDVTLITAPADLTSNTATVDSLLAPKPSISSLNLLINLGYRFNEKLEVGFNVDAIGFSFGPEGSPNYISNGVSKSVKASPTSPNILLVGDNDKGSLNSHFYGRLKLSQKIGLNLAYQFLFNELTTTTKVQVNGSNDRFRSKSGQIYAGLSFHF